MPPKGIVIQVTSTGRLLALSYLMVISTGSHHTDCTPASPAYSTGTLQSGKLLQNDQTLPTGDENCVSDFLELQRQALYCNANNRFKLMQTFAPVNEEVPLALLVTYRYNDTNSSAKSSNEPPMKSSIIAENFRHFCANAAAVAEGEVVWMWTLEPVFLLIRPHILNWFSLTTMMPFQLWSWKHLELDIPEVCQEHKMAYLALFTQQIHYYSGGYNLEPKGQNAFVMVGKGPSAFCGAVHPWPRSEQQKADVAASIGVAGCYLGVLAVFAFTTTWMAKYFPNLSKNSHKYAYQNYGILWGTVITMAIAAPIILAYFLYMIIYFYELPPDAIFSSAPYHVVAMNVIILTIQTPTTVYYSIKYKVALPVTMLRVMKQMCKTRAVGCVHTVVQGSALFLCFYTIHILGQFSLWMIIALIANPYSVMIGAAILLVVLFSFINIFAVIVTLPHSQSTGEGGLSSRAKITLLQVASTVFFTITTACVVCIIAFTKTITTSESHLFSNIRWLIAPVVVVISLAVQKGANSYFGVHATNKGKRKSKALGLSKVMNINSSESGPMRTLAEPLLEELETRIEVEWEPTDQTEMKSEPHQGYEIHSDHTVTVNRQKWELEDDDDLNPGKPSQVAKLEGLESFTSSDDAM